MVTGEVSRTTKSISETWLIRNLNWCAIMIINSNKNDKNNSNNNNNNYYSKITIMATITIIS